MVRFKLWLTALVFCGLTACASPAPVAVNVCPSVKAYTPAQEASLYTEEHALASDDPLFLAMLDYAQLRNEARACAKAQ